MGNEIDVVVVGAGLSGAATAWSAARRGLSVVVVEQFEPDHAFGSSHGSARIIRRAYSDALYVRLTGEAFELWRELEIASSTSLLRELGGLDFGPQRDVPKVARLLTSAGVEHELLSPAEASARWPGMVFDGPVLFHPQAGTLDSAGAVNAFLGVAAGLGAEVRFATPAVAVEPGEPSIVRLADGTALRARNVVVAAGGWVPTLLAGVLDLPPLQVKQQQIFHFPRRDVDQAPWPSVIHEGDMSVYHLAGGRDGGPGDDRKVGDHLDGTSTTAADRDGRPSAESRERVADYVRRWLPGLDPTPGRESTCLYTITPSEDFVIDRIGPLVVCSPCSGHGAKFAPLTGELVAGLLDGSGDVPDRFHLAAHAERRAGRVSL